MPSSVGHTIFTKLYRSRLNSLLQRIVGARLISIEENAESTKNINLALQPGKIHAAVLKEFSNPFVVEHLEPPKRVQHNEVLIDVHYCSLNASDALLSKNSYIFEPKLPTILGYEVLGKLVEVGAEAERKGYRVGDKVIALNKDRYGGLAERCLAEVGDIWKVPSVLKSIDVVSILDNYITALVALERKVNLDENDMILINVGMSGIGLAAVDLATNVFRAKVIGVCATEDGADIVREKGAFTSLKYKNKKLLKQIEEIAAEKDIKAIFDDIGGEYFKKVLGCFTDVYNDATLKDLLRDDNFAVVVHHLSREGRVIVAGTAMTMTDAHSEVQKSSFSVSGFNLTEYRKKKPDIYRQAGDEVLQFLEEGLITSSCSLIVGLHKINDALQFVSESKSPGKVVIDIRNKEADVLKMKN
ncbi:quinone oxidoreductase-like protein 2 [Odontomachus brunneus]|uniref:quinone oxidoreductase-like protein 2 n=1 Tax=Odontomachus brunneus TaxID=486640 RepID=UPI0013F2506C|nr:quinone oxidoreductase-like protein 2 [Odontomachus brunneus]XP_032668735.1 quinone oxidoreductase-like protein 2 [Odontomachus brunneus]XP_032668736.1 quinone oxidoreductase-like protein 2 [Odontomachus brunneus]